MATRYGILSADLWRLRGDLAGLLGGESVRLQGLVQGWPGRRPACDVVLGWGDGRGERARHLARRVELPFRGLTLGPLRSVKPAGEPPMSYRLQLLAGDLCANPAPPPPRFARSPSPRGVGDDASTGKSPPPLGEVAARRADGGGTPPGEGVVAEGASAREAPPDDSVAGLATLRALRLGWRNDGRDVLPAALAGAPFGLVLADGDSVAEAQGRAAEHLRLARADAPELTVAILAGPRLPNMLAADLARGRAGLVPVTSTNTWALFDRAERVWGAADSDLGRLARLAGREVGPLAAASDEGLFAATFLDETVYLDAWSRRPVPFAEAAGQLAWLRDRFLENDRRSHCVGISRWKAARVARFLDGPDGPARFHGSAATAIREATADGGRVVAWETRMPGRLAADCARAGVPLWRMEDGFLRSVGLGAAFLPGASAVLDGRGIYYDPTGPSDLEHLLETAAFTPDLLARARALRREVVGLRLSKYNVGGSEGVDALLASAAGREVVLVPGQVEDDASILLGAPRMAGNLGLLDAARRRNPDAFVVFKPHPDVVAGLRRGAVETDAALVHADRVVTDIGIAELLDRVDAVETMTSLAGFEALMRETRVATHGRPFYAGWGLTQDLDPPERRSRRLSLDELVAASLILYPRYLDPVTGLRCPPEVLVRRLAQAREAARQVSPAREAARMAYVRARHALLTPLGRALRRLKGAVRTGPGPSA